MATEIRKLLLENGQEAGLYDICQWIIDKYPEDIFVSSPVVVCQLRDCAKKIISLQSANKVK